MTDPFVLEDAPRALKDYRLQVRIKNNYLLAAMERRGFRTVAGLARASGEGEGQIGALANLKISGRDSKGNWRKVLIGLSKTLWCLPEDLIPPQHQDCPLKKNTGELDLSLVELQNFGLLPSNPATPELLLEHKDVTRLLEEGMDRLTERERLVINKRFGLNGEEPHSFEEVCPFVGVTRERVRQIEQKALRKLAAASNTGKQLYENWTDRVYDPKAIQRHTNRRPWAPVSGRWREP